MAYFMCIQIYDTSTNESISDLDLFMQHLQYVGKLLNIHITKMSHDIARKALSHYHKRIVIAYFHQVIKCCIKLLKTGTFRVKVTG